MANFHYITRMSSGFKVYILEGKTTYCSSNTSYRLIVMKTFITLMCGTSFMTFMNVYTIYIPATGVMYHYGYTVLSLRNQDLKHFIFLTVLFIIPYIHTFCVKMYVKLLDDYSNCVISILITL